MGPYPLVKLLTVAASLHGVHHNIFCSHKGKLSLKVSRYYLIVYYKSVAYIEIKVKYSVYGKEGFGNTQALVCGVVESSLEPLGGGCDIGIEHVDHYIS